MTATRQPACDMRSASAGPAWPAPMTMASKASGDSRDSSRQRSRKGVVAESAIVRRRCGVIPLRSRHGAAGSRRVRPAAPTPGSPGRCAPGRARRADGGSASGTRAARCARKVAAAGARRGARLRMDVQVVAEDQRRASEPAACRRPGAWSGKGAGGLRRRGACALLEVGTEAERVHMQQRDATLEHLLEALQPIEPGIAAVRRRDHEGLVPIGSAVHDDPAPTGHRRRREDRVELVVQQLAEAPRAIAPSRGPSSFRNPPACRSPAATPHRGRVRSHRCRARDKACQDSTSARSTRGRGLPTRRPPGERQARPRRSDGGALDRRTGRMDSTPFCLVESHRGGDSGPVCALTPRATKAGTAPPSATPQDEENIVIDDIQRMSRGSATVQFSTWFCQF